jgi:hypothetical protein
MEMLGEHPANVSPPRPQTIIWMLLAILPVYTLIFSMAADALQSRRRAPAEFALTALAWFGASALSARVRDVRTWLARISSPARRSS